MDQSRLGQHEEKQNHLKAGETAVISGGRSVSASSWVSLVMEIMEGE